MIRPFASFSSCNNSRFRLLGFCARHLLEPTFELLKAALKKEEGISKTQLVRRANLNFGSIEHYLKRLQAGRFVRLEIVEGNWNRYYVTGEGEHLFKVLDELYELIDN